MNSDDRDRRLRLWVLAFQAFSVLLSAFALIYCLITQR